ncbi:5'-deoxynucleotidase [Vibrio makurazakiensis]|uniref:5'-deoxynucleotidase n=1 Tax=Vibrio makurazakiensis TaxID=2910250 RepID=UPI003D096B8B
MNQSHFFAHLARMKLIQRWPLMRSVSSENISEHSLQVAFVAHALALIKNKKFSGSLNPERIAMLGMYHDASEVLTGDLPTPVKYYNSEIATEYKKIEAAAEKRLLSMVPEEFRDDFEPFLISGHCSEEEQIIVKQADSICAYLKCLEELSAGNHEFEQAKRRLKETLEQRQTPEMEYFLTTFAPSFELSLDEIS